MPKTLNRWLTCLALLVLAGPAMVLRAEVRSYTLGIGVNCPAGLPE